MIVSLVALVVIVIFDPAVNNAFSNIEFVLSYINTCPAAGDVIVVSVKLFNPASKLNVVPARAKPVPAL